MAHSVATCRCASTMLGRALSLRANDRRSNTQGDSLTTSPRQAQRTAPAQENYTVHAPSWAIADDWRSGAAESVAHNVLQPSVSSNIAPAHQEGVHRAHDKAPLSSAPLQRAATSVHRRKSSLRKGPATPSRRSYVFSSAGDGSAGVLPQGGAPVATTRTPPRTAPIAETSTTPGSLTGSPASVSRSRSFKSYFHRMGLHKPADSPLTEAAPNDPPKPQEVRRPPPPTVQAPPEPAAVGPASREPISSAAYHVPAEELTTVLMQGSRAVQRRQHAGTRSFSSPTHTATRHKYSQSVAGVGYMPDTHPSSSPPRPKHREEDRAKLPPFTFPLQQAPFPGADPCSTPPSLASSSSTIGSDTRLTPKQAAAPNTTTTSDAQLGQLKRTLELELQPPTQAAKPWQRDEMRPAPRIVAPDLYAPPKPSPKRDLTPSPTPQSVRDAIPLFHNVGAERGLVYEHPDSLYTPEALRSQRASIETILPSDLQQLAIHDS